MKRDLEESLKTWKSSHARMPLLLRGARQVGKTYVVEKFGRNYFANCVTVNFEQHPELDEVFSTLEPNEIVTQLELITHSSIKPGQTLLFLDEIQVSPRAILALRYFKEQMPELHVIGAGSLLEFTLNDSSFRMPVGRIQFLFLYPLSFAEFLTALGEDKLREYLSEISVGTNIPKPVHEKLLSLVRLYSAIGGMPASVQSYLETKGLQSCREVLSDLLLAYRNDFGKYATRSQHKHLQLLFEKAPGLVAQWFKYVKVDPHAQSRDLRSALEALNHAGLVQLVFATSATGLPLITTANSRKFKLLFLDLGLVNRATQIDLNLVLKSDFIQLNQGALAEQFVGQELLAYSSPREAIRLFFWVREKKGSSAEVDYITTVDGAIVPIEVKAGNTGRLRSLRLFMEEKSSPIGVRISSAPLSLDSGILSIPFYLTSQLARLVQAV